MRRDEEEIEEGGSGCLTWPPILYKIRPKVPKGRLVVRAYASIVDKRRDSNSAKVFVGF